MNTCFVFLIQFENVRYTNQVVNEKQLSLLKQNLIYQCNFLVVMISIAKRRKIMKEWFFYSFIVDQIVNIAHRFYVGVISMVLNNQIFFSLFCVNVY